MRIVLVRGGMSALIVVAILLHRNVFSDDFDDVIVGLVVVVVVMGIGLLVGVVIILCAI
jgi:hypothetical protein